MLFFRRLLAATLLLVLPWSAFASEVYKWVDEAGNTHFGDRIPEKYQKTGETLDVVARQPTTADRQKAEAIAESIRQAADAAYERRLQESEPEPVSPEQLPQKVSSHSPPNTLKPGQARLTRKQRMENYEAEMTRYRESQRCFAQFQKLGGGTRGYAFNHCNTVERPIHPDVR